jgi:hypothetical protein
MRGVTSTGWENYYRLIGEPGGNCLQRADNRTAAALKFAALVNRASSDTYDCLVKIIPNVFPGIDHERTHCIRVMYPFFREQIYQRTVSPSFVILIIFILTYNNNTSRDVRRWRFLLRCSHRILDTTRRGYVNVMNSKTPTLFPEQIDVGSLLRVHK